MDLFTTLLSTLQTVFAAVPVLQPLFGRRLDVRILRADIEMSNRAGGGVIVAALRVTLLNRRADRLETVRGGALVIRDKRSWRPWRGAVIEVPLRTLIGPPLHDLHLPPLSPPVDVTLMVTRPRGNPPFPRECDVELVLLTSGLPRKVVRRVQGGVSLAPPS